MYEIKRTTPDETTRNREKRGEREKEIQKDKRS